MRDVTTSEVIDVPPRRPLLLRIHEAAFELSLSPRSIWRLIGSGQLDVVRSGRSIRVTRESIERFVAKGGTPA